MVSQILHIFRKDARRHCTEILVSLLLLAAFTWKAPREWGARLYLSAFRQFMEGTVDVLLPVAWCFLIVRIVHGEPLVGDRQFWVTRPYEWKKLLAAKVFFVAVFISVPLFVAQVILLREAGLAIIPHLLGLLQMHAGVGWLLMMPAVLGAVTRGLGQAVIVALGGIVALIGAAALFSVIPNAEMSSANIVGGALQGLVSLVAPAAAVLWQYARRRTWQSRGLLLGAVAVIALIEVASPYDALVKRKYPLLAAGQKPRVQLTLGTVEASARKKDLSWDSRDEVSIRIPLRVSGVGRDKVVAVDGMRMRIEGPGGVQWNPWWKGWGPRFWPDKESTSVSFEVKKEFYEKVKSTPVTMYISLALTEYRERDVREVVATDGEFVVRGVGLCRIEEDFFRSLRCRAPLREPSVMASIAFSKTACSGEESGDLPVAEEKVSHGFQLRDDDFANPGVSPVKIFGIYFEDSYIWQSPAEKEVRPRLCPGAPLRVGKPEEIGHSRIELQVGGIKLEDYEVGRFSLH